MGVLKIDCGAQEGRGDLNPCPFDFVHVKIQDHRRLRREKPDLFARCHAKRIDPEDDKFNMNPGCFQYAYTVLGPHVSGGPIMCRVVNDNGVRFGAISSGGTLGHGVTLSQACYVDLEHVGKAGKKGKGRGRRPGDGQGTHSREAPAASPCTSLGVARDAGYDAPRRRWKCRQPYTEASL